MDIRLTGTIKKITSNFGIIISESDKVEYFFNSFNIKSEKTLKENDTVTFDLIGNKRGTFDASNIVLKERKKALKNTLKNRFSFLDITDFHLAYELIGAKLKYQLKNIEKFEYPDEVSEEIEFILGVFEDLIHGETPNINDIPIADLNEFEPSNIKSRNHPKYWLHNLDLQDLAIRLIELGKIEPKSSIKKDFTCVWGEWRDNTKQNFNHGYQQGFFQYSYIDKGEVEQTHVYIKPPPKTTWELKKIEQKGHIFYITSAPVNEIAQSSYVPSLPPQLNITETAKRIIDSSYKSNEWQREIDKNRVRKIEQFIDDGANLVANTPMLFVNNSDCVEIRNNKLTINFDSFLKKQIEGEFKGKYIDRKKRDEKDDSGNIIYDDYRPLWLIDGQHRVKGIHRNEFQQSLEIPIIIFPHEFGPQATAKVFAEINTLQKKLNPLHELFMQHRFSIDHINPKRKFKNFRDKTILEATKDGWEKDWLHSRANHYAYEIAALLAKDGTLKDKIQFLSQNNSQNTLVSADQWVNYSRDLFYSKCYKYKSDFAETYIENPSVAESKLSERELFYTEVKNYFDAWVEVSNHDGWEELGKTYTWIPDLKNKGLILRKSHFIILIELYNTVWQKAQDYKIKYHLIGHIKKEEFVKILSVFKWVDWNDRTLINTYSGGGERGRRSLEAWMSDAILNGVISKYDEIHNENPEELMSIPGKGICSYLKSPNIEIKSSLKFPTKNTHVILKSPRPHNARYEATWSVYDKEENLIAEKKSSCQKHLLNTFSTFNLKYISLMDKLDFLIVQVEWKNAHIRTGKNKIILSKT